MAVRGSEMTAARRSRPGAAAARLEERQAGGASHFRLGAAPGVGPCRIVRLLLLPVVRLLVPHLMLLRDELHEGVAHLVRRLLVAAVTGQQLELQRFEHSDVGGVHVGSHLQADSCGRALNFPEKSGIPDFFSQNDWISRFVQKCNKIRR